MRRVPDHTYPTYANACGWSAMLPQRQNRPALAQDVTVDYAVIGAGYTGLAVARRLHELDNQASIAMLDATTVGEGSSARNSGFTTPEVLPRFASSKSAAAAMQQTLLMRASFQWFTDIISDNDINCDMHKVGAIRAAATEAGEAALRRVLDLARTNGIKHTVLSNGDIRDRIGSDYYRFGLHLSDTYLLQPAALVRGLTDSLPYPVTLYENTSVQRLERDGPDWILHTSGGLVRTRNVVLANNSFIPKLGYLKLRMATIYTYAAVTRALTPSERTHVGQLPAWGLLPSHRLGTTSRRIGQDRLMVRSLYAHEKQIEQPEAVGKLHARFARRWPDLSHVDLEYVWAGATAFTMNGAPWWGKLDNGLYASGGCNGSGIAKGTMLGRHLAELILGMGDPNRIPAVMGTASLIAPEPFRSIGFQMISALERRKAGLEI
jgi:glycine/D-amino acid oxidase-like deaminating enzyme